MDTLSAFVAKFFDGAQIIVRPSKRRSSRSERKKSIIVAKAVERWLNGPTNRSTMSSLLYQCLRDGAGIGMFTGTGWDFERVSPYKFYAENVIDVKPLAKTRRGENERKSA